MKEKIKNWLKNNWFKITIIALLFVVLVCCIYFVWIRPIMAKRDCFNRAYTYISTSSLSLDQRDWVYKVCLHKYGL